MASISIEQGSSSTIRQQAEKKYIKTALAFTALLVAGVAYGVLSALFPVLAVGLPTVYGLMATCAAGLLYQMANLRALKRDFPSPSS